MNCDVVRNTLPLLVRQELKDSTRAASLRHVDECQDCAYTLNEEQTFVFTSRIVVDSLNDQARMRRIELALLRALRDRDKPVRVRVKTSFFSLKTALALASLLLLVSVSAIWMRRDSRPEELSAKTTVPNASSETVRKEEPLSSTVSTSVSKSTVSKSIRRPRATRPRTVTASEETTEFFSLAEGEDLNSIEVAQVARIELPASAILELGLQVSPEVPNGSITADVLLGPDGQARAIRFVR